MARGIVGMRGAQPENLERDDRPMPRLIRLGQLSPAADGLQRRELDGQVAEVEDPEAPLLLIASK